MTDCQSCKPEPPPRPSRSESWSIRGTVTHGTVRRSDRPGRRRAAGAVSPASASYCCSASLSEFSGTGCARSVHRQRRHEIPLTLLVPDAVRVKSTSRTRKAAASNPNARRSTDSVGADRRRRAAENRVAQMAAHHQARAQMAALAAALQPARTPASSYVVRRTRVVCRAPVHRRSLRCCGLLLLSLVFEMPCQSTSNPCYSLVQRELYQAGIPL